MSTQSCPSCSATIPVASGYVTWCDHCSWNVVAPPVPAPRGWFERAYASAGEKAGARLAAQLLRAESLEPRLTPSRIAAYAIAGTVHLFTLAFVVIGLWVIEQTLPNPFGIVLGLAVASPALLFAPRLPKLPKDARTVDRAAAPTLFELTDEVAARLGTKGPSVIVIDAEYNASWYVAGWRRRRVLTLGLPLFTPLEPQERAALVAHELAHGRNGDASRGFFVGGAINALWELFLLVRPERRSVGLEFFINWVFIAVSRPVWWLLQLEFHLLRRDSQRAEYLADTLAASAAGSAAVVAMHEKLLLETVFRGVVQHAVHSEDDLFASLVTAVQAVPERERERRRRVARLETSSLGDSHPPTAMRIALLEGRAAAEPTVTLDPERSAAVDRELTRLRPELRRTLIDEYRARVYRR